MKWLREWPAPARGFLGALRGRPTLAAALIYAILVTIFLSPALMPGKTLSNSDMLWYETPYWAVKPPGVTGPSNTELGDAPGQLQPFLRYAADRFPEMPLWNPYIVGGRPFLANAQSAVFSPFTLPAYVLPFWTAINVIGLLKLWVAAFGMFLLASRALGMRFGGALMAGTTYAFSLWMVTWLSYPHMSVWALMPWMMLLADRLVRRPDLFAGASLSALLCVQFLAGHPESSFHALLTTFAFLVLRLIQVRRAEGADSRRVLRTLAAFGAAVAGGVALAALVIIPFGELLRSSADLHDRQGDSIDLQPLLRDFGLGMFFPDYWGKPTGTPIRFFVLNRAIYVGALPLMLAVAALVTRPNLERLAVAAFGGLWLGVLFGVPPFLQIVTRLPVFSSGHNSRLIALFVVSLALLAGWGLDDLSSRRWPGRTRTLVLAGAALLLAVPVLYGLTGGRTHLSDFGSALKVAWGFATPPGMAIDPTTGGRICGGTCTPAGGIIRLASVIGWVTLAGAALLLLSLRARHRIGPAPFVALAMLLVCVDLFHAGMGYNPAIDRKYASQPATGAIRVLERHRDSRFVSMQGVPHNVISMKYRLYEARGYDLPIIRRFDRLWRREVSPESSSVAKGLLDTFLTLRNVTPAALRVLRLLGVTEIMQPLQDRPLRLPGVRLRYGGPDARVYRVEGALPRAWVVPAQRLVGGEEAAFGAVTDPGFDGRRAAVTERRVGGVPLAGPAGGRGAAARIVSYEPERVVVRARSSRAGLLVLSDTWFPGWKATVDGRPVGVERVNYVMRGVRVGAGAHTVEFRYRPLSWRIGWIVSLVSLLGLVAALAVGLRRRRREGPEPGLESLGDRQSGAVQPLT